MGSVVYIVLALGHLWFEPTIVSSSSIRFCSLSRASILSRKREFSSITLWRRRARLSSNLLRRLHSSPVWNNALKGRDDRKWQYADKAIPKTWAATCTFRPMNAHFLLAYFCTKETRLPPDWSGTQYLSRPVSRLKHVWQLSENKQGWCIACESKVDSSAGIATNICLGRHSGSIVSFIMIYTMNVGREKTMLKNSRKKWRQHCIALALPVLPVPPKTQIHSFLILLVRTILKTL